MFADKLELTMTETMLVAVAGIIVVLLELALLSVLILLLSRVLRAVESKVSTSVELGGNDTPATTATPVAVPSTTPAAVVPTAEGIQLIGVDERTAAVVMALVSHQSGIPLEKLSFKSIRCLAPAGLELEGVDEDTVAAIMAIVSNESGIPLERLAFKSIKKVEE